MANSGAAAQAVWLFAACLAEDGAKRRFVEELRWRLGFLSWRFLLLRWGKAWRFMANDSSSATRPAGRVDCNRSAMAGFAAAPG